MTSLVKSTTPGVDYHEFRDSLYYGKYEYKVVVDSPGMRLAYLAKNMQDLLLILSFGERRYMTLRDKTDVYENMDSIENYYQWSVRFSDMFANGDIKLRKGDRNRVILFANNLALLQDFENIFFKVNTVQYTRAICTQPNVKYFTRKPQHQWRTYLKSKYISLEQRTQIIEFMNKNKDTLIPSPSFRRWIERGLPFYRRRLITRSYFMDYDQEYMSSYIILSIGEYVYRSYELRQNDSQE